MGGTSPNYADWRSLSAIEIHEVAVLMHGVDPRALKDVMVEDSQNPGDAYGIPLDASWEERMLISAVKTQDILSAPLNFANPNRHTEVSRMSLTPWLRAHGYQDLANKFDNLAPLPSTPLPASSPSEPRWGHAAFGGGHQHQFQVQI